MKLRIFVLLFWGLAGCHSNDKIPSQMEEVLRHYKTNAADSLKYRAALFLIRNMKDKYSFTGEQYSTFLHFIDSLSTVAASTGSYKDSINSYQKRNKTLIGAPSKSYDLNAIAASFLIRNIDEAFVAWESAPWAHSVNFEYFCEYILPYRIGNEPVEDFRKMFYKDYHAALKPYPNITIRQAADTLLRLTSERKVSILTYPDAVGDLPASILTRIKAGTCGDYSNLAIYIMRSQGIPVAADFTPQWPHRSRGHSWTALITGKDSCIDFGGIGSKNTGAELRLSVTNRIAKIYRNTFSRQAGSLAMQHGNEPVPAFFENPYIKDVTGQYFSGVDVSISVPSSVKGNNRFAYLCVFDNKNWVPIQWGHIQGSNVTFYSMGTSVVYMPALYRNGKLEYIDQPFLLDSNGQKKPFNADERIPVQVQLTRKYPVFDWWNTRTLAMKGGRIQAACQPDFSDAITVYTIRDTPSMIFQTAAITVAKSYRYWRYLAPDGFDGEIAELEFYDEHAQPITGRVIGTIQKLEKYAREKAFDKDPLTFFSGDSTFGNWVGMAFDRPQHMTRIRYLCHNDDNFIRNNESYELYYWKNGVWKSLGQRTGDDNQILKYSNVPVHALLLLRNHTKGSEERIFTYDHDHQVWW